MIEPLDRSRRDSTLFKFTSKQLRDFIDPNHLLSRIDEQLDFAKLVAPLEEYYCPDFGRPAIHPEVMVRALLICSLYNIASFRRLCLAILGRYGPRSPGDKVRPSVHQLKPCSRLTAQVWRSVRTRWREASRKATSG